MKIVQSLNSLEVRAVHPGGAGQSVAQWVGTTLPDYIATPKPAATESGQADPVGDADAWFLALQLCVIYAKSWDQDNDPHHVTRIYEALWAGGIMELIREARRSVLGEGADSVPGLATGVTVACLPAGWHEMTDADDDRATSMAYEFVFGDCWVHWRRPAAPVGVREALNRAMQRIGLPNRF